jgi:ketosteroid isomerase-like protein
VRCSAVALATIAAVTASVASHEVTARPKRPPIRYASPAAIVAADVAMSQLAQRKGQWAAMRDMATEDAMLFVPQPTIARAWLKAQQPTARPAAWQPQQVWLSCDGSLAVSYGATRLAAGGPGYYTTVWQRQKKGDYKWVMTQSDGLAAALAAPDMIGAGVATCDRTARPQPALGAPVPPPPAFPAGTRGGWSDDRTLSWAVAVDGTCGRALTVSLYRGLGKPMEPVLQKQVAGSAGSACPAS